jgi:hypothetical protein
LQKKSEKMKGIRASTNKRPHSGGARPFAARAEEYAQKGEQAPHAKTYIDMYKKFDPDGTVSFLFINFFFNIARLA